MKGGKLLAPALLLSALFVYAAVAALPYRFSPQSDIVPQTLTGVYDPVSPAGTFHGRRVNSPPETATLARKSPDVLGDYRADKRIEVDLTNQRLYAFEGDAKIYDFPISSGKWGRTPTGEFTVWTKLRYTRMKGGNRALGTYYNLPNVPFTMYFSNAEVPSWRGYGIHGTYWHSNFGHPMSHGCINMKTEEVQQLYYWAQPDLPEGKSSVRSSPENPGTRVVIYGTAPSQ